MAIWLVSQQQATGTDGPNPTRPDRKGVGYALAAGVAIGLFFLALANTTATAGLWPLVAARAAAITFFGGIAFLTGRTLRLPNGVISLALAGGVLDMLANILYLLATRQGPFTLAVTLSSLYPASTVMLARAVLHERLASPQWIGVFVALIAIVIIVG